MPQQPDFCPLSAVKREAARVADNLVRSLAISSEPFSGTPNAPLAGSANRGPTPGPRAEPRALEAI